MTPKIPNGNSFLVNPSHHTPGTRARACRVAVHVD